MLSSLSPVGRSEGELFFMSENRSRRAGSGRYTGSAHGGARRVSSGSRSGKRVAENPRSNANSRPGEVEKVVPGEVTVRSGAPRTPRRRRRRRRNRLLPMAAALVLVIAALFAVSRAIFREPEQKESPASSAVSSAVSVPEIQSHYERKENFYTVLVSGVDNGNGGSDTNILVAVDAAKGKIYGVSIPRDTKAYVGSKAYKINAAYAIGGMEGLADVVSTQLGIPVDYTVKVDLGGFVALVEAIGGVDFYVPVDMDYDDPYQNLSIHFKKGMQHLGGEDAMKVVRFRHNNDGTGYGNEDIGRMDTQQDFLMTVAKQMLKLENLDKLDDFVRIFQSHVETDLSLGNLAWLGKAAVEMGAGSIAFSTLPSSWKSPYMYLDREAVLTLVNTYLNPYVEARTMEDLNIP